MCPSVQPASVYRSQPASFLTGCESHGVPRPRLTKSDTQHGKQGGLVPSGLWVGSPGLGPVPLARLGRLARGRERTSGARSRKLRAGRWHSTGASPRLCCGCFSPRPLSVSSCAVASTGRCLEGYVLPRHQTVSWAGAPISAGPNQPQGQRAALETRHSNRPPAVTVQPGTRATRLWSHGMCCWSAFCAWTA
jgi:hypothetical protein